MELSNKTWNQHFVSQVEQRLNCIDPGVNKANQRIHVFEIVDRENHTIKSLSQSGVKIKNNLAIDDLYTFSLLDGTMRENFENLFGNYEKDVGKYIGSLLGKIDNPDSDIKSEIVNILALKLLNSFRNPYSIKKTINTFPLLAGLSPTDPMLASIHERVLQASLQKDDSYLEALGVSRDEYDAWLGYLFLLLMRPKGQINLFEAIIKNLLESNTLMKNVAIYHFSEGVPGVLISDRSSVQPTHDDFHLAFLFNLSSRAFMLLSFVDVETQTWIPVSTNVIAAFEKARYPIQVKLDIDNFRMLSIYNSLAVYQSYSQVFCSNLNPYGVTCLR